ncbi:hypothetical protein [Riemerella columbina]|uniref:hypothetical protein n=1 Tax=Riemerella columbina TaxID=103810 RepID=UPI000361078F|nr:hypothetical protein [Riemerella columbina]
MILSLILSLILMGLAIIHFSRVFGGTLGFAQSIPTKENGERLFNPKKEGYYHRWIIPSLFILRSICGFKYLCFFKTIRNTPFAKTGYSL